MIVEIQVNRPSYHDLPHIEVPRTAVTEMNDTVLPVSCVQPAVQKSARCTRVDCLWVLAEREDLSKAGPEDYDVGLAPTKGQENLVAMGDADVYWSHFGERLVSAQLSYVPSPKNAIGPTPLGRFLCHLSSDRGATLMQ